MRRWLARALALVALALALLWAWGLNQAVRMPVERQITLPLPGLPPGTPPYRVALLSDIHFGNRAMQPERLAAIVAAVNARHPDLVLLAGDYVNTDGLVESSAGLRTGLAGFKARDGVIAVFGNHDHWPAPQTVRAVLDADGIKVLANSAVRAGPLLVLGLDDAHSGYAQIDRLEAARAAARAAGDSGAPLVLTHSPAAIPLLPATMPVVLAGHTHCGQIVLPGIGSLASWIGKRRLSPRYICGLTREPGRTVLTTGGVGSGSIPVRIGAPPDWWLITLTGG
ncbi:MAG: metallophosphoesterase [Proteobacteria bacterium]|nr:metallophosphoesterase [Pseudomonadota bacterium]